SALRAKVRWDGDSDCHTSSTKFSRTRVDRMPVTSDSVSVEIPVKWPSFTTPASMNAFFRVAEEKRVPERKPVSNSGSSNSHIPGGGRVVWGLQQKQVFIKTKTPCPPKQQRAIASQQGEASYSSR
ncbi:hypothetical protein NQZ68_039540, partial [Dissostichus eleginoides]